MRAAHSRPRLCSYIDHSDDPDSHRVSHYNQQRILDALSPGLRQEVVLYTNSALLSRLPSLARQIPEVQAWVVERLRRRIVSLQLAEWAQAAGCMHSALLPCAPRS